jgi:hypothetical protein
MRPTVSSTRNVRNLEVAAVAGNVVRGTECWIAAFIRAVEKGSRYQSNKIGSLKDGLRDQDRKCGLEKREPVAERKHDGEQKQPPNKRQQHSEPEHAAYHQS